MASQLTPVVITDKNGRVTTVHRKTQKTGKARAIPAPKRDFTSEGQKAMLKLGIEGTYAKTAVPNLAYLAEHNPKLLERIYERCAQGGKEEKVWKLKLSFTPMFKSPDQMVTHNEMESCHALLELYSVADRIAEAKKQPAPGMISLIITSTMEYAERYSGNGWDTMRMAMVANEFIEDDDEKHDLIFGSGLWQRLPEIIEIIPELARRGKVDSDTIEMLLDAEHKALLDGEL